MAECEVPDCDRTARYREGTARMVAGADMFHTCHEHHDYRAEYSYKFNPVDVTEV